MTDSTVSWLIGFAHFGSATALGETTQKLPSLDSHMTTDLLACVYSRQNRSIIFSPLSSVHASTKSLKSHGASRLGGAPTRPFAEHWFTLFSLSLFPFFHLRDSPLRPSGWDKEQQEVEARADQPTPWRHHHHHDLTHNHARRQQIVEVLHQVSVKCFN